MTRRRVAPATIVIVVVLLVAVAAAATAGSSDGGRASGRGGATPPTRNSSASSPTTRLRDAGPVTASPRPVPIGAAAPLPTASPPVTVDIPSIGVHSNLELLHLGADGTLEAPEAFGLAGWYADGPQPGRPGPAVIAGHVDSKSGPAVFFHLAELAPGDPIAVRRQDGTTAHFVVTGSNRYPKAAFPTEIVYAPTPDPELRLITCSGAFDRSSGHYIDNTVVSARLVTG